MLDLKINHLQLLAQIVSTGSLTEAAQNLGLSAAAASRMLKKLQTCKSSKDHSKPRNEVDTSLKSPV
ncbi:helix-turn-helix domain-containing protein [Sutterella wadsworthensis]|uniref:helix-turn-helix domain-containing protein n=1 Tax=Sutterella wadsworthensis TaxID=40545 RepID=UPI003AB91DBB